MVVSELGLKQQLGLTRLKKREPNRGTEAWKGLVTSKAENIERTSTGGGGGARMLHTQRKGCSFVHKSCKVTTSPMRAQCQLDIYEMGL